jgi:hypothetical protein
MYFADTRGLYHGRLKMQADCEIFLRLANIKDKDNAAIMPAAVAIFSPWVLYQKGIMNCLSIH